MKRFSRLSDNIITTPPHIAEEMVGILPEDITADSRFLNIAGKTGEFENAIVNRYGDAVKNNIYTLPINGVTYECTLKMYKMLGIPTITNDSYSPDFMYIVKKKNGTKELNIIVETKGVDVPAHMRDVEEKKIRCAMKFFNQLREDYPELNVNFKDQLNNQQLRKIIEDVINSNQNT